MADLQAATISRLNLRDQLLDNFPDLTEDADALFDTLSGIDDFEEQCLAVLRNAIEREAMGRALAELIAGMQARKQRLEEGAKNLRNAVLHAMQETGQQRIKAPDFSVSIGAGKPKVMITEEAMIPEHLCRVKREPDKAAIGKALTSGQAVPGATLGNAAPFLSIHKG
jgi:hypothetical protein